MEYTIAKLAKLAGISTRTLRYYDSIGLLTPLRQTDAGYRIYGTAEVDKLQQILFYRELDIPLEEITGLLSAPNYDAVTALRSHRLDLTNKLIRLQRVIETLDKTIDANERKITMNDKEKFEGLKDTMIADNEAAYGAELRANYGGHTIDAANHKLKGFTAEELGLADRLAAEILALLDTAFETNDPAGEAAIRLAARHKEWLCLYWPEYNKEAHAGLCDMYTADPRFAAYYDRGTPGKAAFLRNAVHSWLKN